MTQAALPSLAFSDWEKTYDTLHMWLQIAGKTRLALMPKINHWWGSVLYVTPRGLGTSSIPYKDRAFDVEFDFVTHRVVFRVSDGRDYVIPLYDRSVADFYAEYMSALRQLEIEVAINRVPSEFDDLTPFDEDQQHASYDRKPVENLYRILLFADRVFTRFRAGFLGKCSPVHFFWGSFDLAVTRFSGRPASPRPEMDAMTREAYSHEVSSCGFWPGDRGRLKYPIFYAYSAPAPPGLEKAAIRPEAAGWNASLGEFILKYDDLRSAASPEQALLDFCTSAYEAGATLAGWDRAALERPARKRT